MMKRRRLLASLNPADTLGIDHPDHRRADEVELLKTASGTVKVLPRIDPEFFRKNPGH